jgi:hypothetical protein
MSEANRDAVRAFLSGAIDDAGLFPPARLSMRDALLAHDRAANGPHAWVLGRFVVPASRLAELSEALGKRSTPLRTSVVLDGATTHEWYAATVREIQAGTGRISIEAIELKLEDLPGADPSEKAKSLTRIEHSSALSEPHATFVEIGIEDDAHLELNLLAFGRPSAGASIRRYAKVRTGGVDAATVPAPDRLAQFIARTRDLEIPFKATAGLHHAVRRQDAEAGFAMHGFLNVFAASILARTHVFDRAKLEAILLDESAQDFRLSARCFEWRGAMAEAYEIAAARRSGIRSFGSCSFEEPIADLISLGILSSSA